MSKVKGACAKYRETKALTLLGDCKMFQRYRYCKCSSVLCEGEKAIIGKRNCMCRDTGHNISRNLQVVSFSLECL